MEMYNLASNSWSKVQSMRQSRQRCGVTVFNGKICVIGGLGWPSNTLNTMEVYDPRCDRWIQVEKNMSQARCGAAAMYLEPAAAPADASTGLPSPTHTAMQRGGA